MYKLLIVDDEPIIRRGIKSLANLATIGISHIDEASNGEDAIDRAAFADIIMLDINMPRRDGLEVAEIIKKNNPNVLIVMVTGYDYFEYTQKAIRIGVDDYLLKPVNKQDVELVIKRMVDKLGRRNVKEKIDKINSHANQEPDLEGFAQVREYIEQHIYDMGLSLGLLAETLGFNSSYLSGIIKRIYGIPFQEYVSKRRMERAKILLLSGNMKNYEIAEQLGFDDVNYFITKFKKTYGVTPKQYKQGVRSNEI